MIREGWETNLHTALLFFRYCVRYKVPLDKDIRAAIFRRIAAKGKAKYLRDVDEAISGHNVIQIKRRSN